MRIKVVATLGPSSSDYETMKRMVEYGVRIFRLNFSHSSAESFVPVVENIRRLEKEFGIPLTAMGDLCGPKTRIGQVKGSPLNVNKGETVSLGLPETEKDADGTFISLDFPELLTGLDVGMPVSLSDGMLQFQVTRVVEKDRLFELTANNAGLLTSHKGIAFPGKSHPVAALTDKDRNDLCEGLAIGLDAVAMSFVQTRKDVEDVKAEIAKCGRNVPVCAKIERQNAVDNLEDILEVADVIMVARGDLGLECPLWEVPVIQKKIIRACRHHQKACIVATQMLLSMVKNPIPTRAEATDVANAIMDGADCVMLSEETAIGSYPVQTIQFIQDIAGAAEEYYLERSEVPYEPDKEVIDPPKYMAYAACILADSTGSSAQVCHSTSGHAARLMSSRRPHKPIYALTPDTEVQRWMNFFWGVRPRSSDPSIRNHMERCQEYIRKSAQFLEGESVVITSGPSERHQGKLHTNKIKIYYK